MLMLSSVSLFGAPAVPLVRFTDQESNVQHPDAHIDGFSLLSVLLTEQRADATVLHRRRLRFDDHPPRRRLDEAPPFSTTENSRERVITLMKLNVAVYPDYLDTTVDRTWSQEVMDGIIADQRQQYDTSASATKASDDAANAAINTAAKAELGTESSSEAEYLYSPSATAKYTTGVAALEWTRGNVTVLVFRGSYSEGDFGNIENWFMDYVLERSTARMKEAWTVDGGLTWTSTMQERHERGDLFARTAIRGQSFYLDGSPSSGKFAEDLADAVAADPSLATLAITDSSAKAKGYWPLTKQMVDGVLDALPSGQVLLLTGHSQGATRAQLASMYLAKSRGTYFTTMTFAATGGACAARLLFNTNDDLLDDVDPYVRHDQITDYTHPLDPWGSATLGVDNGDVCFWGTTGLAAGDSAYEYCSRIYGYTGPTLIAAQGGVYTPGGADSSAGHDFRRCRYFTHDAEATLRALEQPGVVLADGTTDGGCRAAPLIPAGDTSSDGCPTGNWAVDEVMLAVGLGLGISCCCCGISLGIYYCLLKRRQKKQVSP